MRLFSTTRQLSRYNRIVLVGNIGADPTYKEISSANDNVYKKWRFSLATNRSKKIGGQWERLTDWHNVETFRTVEHLGVGSTVVVEGVLTYNEYEKDNVKHRVAIIEADRVVPVSGRKDQEPEE